MVKYSFIIPVKEVNDYIRESVPKILALARDDFEIIIYPDDYSSDVWPQTRQIATGHLGPAAKRSLAQRDAQGDFLIFIDDDAYPAVDFLTILDQDLSRQDFCALGGPAITPKDDSFWQKVSGAVFLSSLSGGNPERYAAIGEVKFVDDWPSVNLVVSKKNFLSVNGFDSSYWPGEDTKFCLDLIKYTGQKILYDPRLVVYHHRRSGLLKHLGQIANYGLHRGFFAKKFPDNSLKPKYFLPSIFLLFIVVGAVISFYFPSLAVLYVLGWLAYIAALVKAGFDIERYEKNIFVICHALYYIFLTHLAYGAKFLQGFIFTKELKSKLR
ncbi:MAG: glycosyltransferase [Patescibacteria group bacterium]